MIVIQQREGKAGTTEENKENHSDGSLCSGPHRGPLHRGDEV